MANGYMPDVRQPYSFLLSSGFTQLAGAALNSPFACPSMFTGHRANYYDTRNPAGGWANPVSNDTDRRSAAFWVDVGYDANFPLQNRTGQIFSGYYATNLENVHPTIVKNVSNTGYFPVPEWRSQPSTIAYLFEDFFWTSGPVFSYTNAITLGSGGYQPPIRHNNYSSTNLLYADGHVIKFPTPTFTSLADISDSKNDVWMNFY